MELLYLDFAKAFDLVDLSVLVQKLHKASIHGKALQWILSFLMWRTQRVRVENSLSSERRVWSGVPKGSVMGPILFLVYISDLQHSNPRTYSMLLKFDKSDRG